MPARVIRHDSFPGPEIFSGPIHVRPVSLVHGDAARTLLASGDALPLAGSGIGFAAVDLLARTADGLHVARLSVSSPPLHWVPGVAEQLVRLGAPRSAIAGLDMSTGPHLMGIVNVTPDSFSDGGRFETRDRALDHARRLAAEGAAILDIGGESTRPGATAVSEQEEMDRVVPVIETLAADGHRISVDTRKAGVMRAALAAGAAMVNDVSGLTYDPAAPDLLATAACPVVLMHMRDDPGTMQNDPQYDHAPIEVYDELSTRVEAAVSRGIDRGRLVVDPGFGFAKNDAHNVEVSAQLALLHALGCPILFGGSRKSSIARLSRGEPVDARLPGSIALALAAARAGAQILRVHDVAETHQALAVQSSLLEAG